MKKIVIASGYFNPVHSGHIDLFKGARKLGDKLIVILNNDAQVKMKNSFSFMNEKERKKVIQSIKYVDNVVISADKDKTVCKTIGKIYNDVSKKEKCFFIFANGGDRKQGNIPEDEACQKLGIKMVYNVGGGKSQSSSWLIRNVKKCPKHNEDLEYCKKCLKREIKKWSKELNWSKK